MHKKHENEVIDSTLQLVEIVELLVNSTIIFCSVLKGKEIFHPLSMQLEPRKGWFTPFFGDHRKRTQKKPSYVNDIVFTP